MSLSGISKFDCIEGTDTITTVASVSEIPEIVWVVVNTKIPEPYLMVGSFCFPNLEGARKFYGETAVLKCVKIPFFVKVTSVPGWEPSRVTDISYPDGKWYI